MQNNRQAVLIWDLPTRLFHWALVVCIVGAFVTVKLGGLYMDWHIRFGCATLGLLLFRLIWASSAALCAFQPVPARPRGRGPLLKGAAAPAGHNPLRLIWAHRLHAQRVSAPAAPRPWPATGRRPPGTIRWGRCRCWRCCWCWASRRSAACHTSDDIMQVYGHVAEATAGAMTSWHKLNEWVIIGLVALHLLAGSACAGAPQARLVRHHRKADARTCRLARHRFDDNGAGPARAAAGGMVTGLVLWIRLA